MVKYYQCCFNTESLCLLGIQTEIQSPHSFYTHTPLWFVYCHYVKVHGVKIAMLCLSLLVASDVICWYTLPFL